MSPTRYLIPGCLGLITVGGLGLRLWNLGAGLPHFPQPDERTLVGLAVRFGTGDFNPHFFQYPTLWPYTLFAALGGFFAIGNVTRILPSLQYFYAQYFVDPSPFFMVGRVLSAFLGTATIPIVYCLARRPASSWVGLLAATAFAAAPLHVEYSHYLVTDVPLTFAVAISFLLLLGYSVGRPGVRLWHVGVAAGLATSVKYPAALLAFPILIAVLARLPRPWTASRIVTAATRAGGWMVAGFLMGTPYAVLAPSEFFAGVKTEFVHAGTGHLGFDPNVNGFFHYLTTALPEGTGILLETLGLGGFLWMTAVGIARRQLAPLLAASFVIPYFFMIGSSKAPFARYLLPLFPFTMIYAGFALERIAQSISVGGPRRAMARLCVLLVAVSPPLAASVNWVSALSRPDTRWLAKQWLEQHVPQGTTLVTELYGPPLNQSLEQLQSQIAELRGLSDPDHRLDRQLKRWTEKYEVLSRVPAARPSFFLYELAPRTPRPAEVDRLPYALVALRAKGAKYAVLTSYMYERFQRSAALYADEIRFHHELERTGRLVFEISPLGPSCAASPVAILDQPIRKQPDQPSVRNVIGKLLGALADITWQDRSCSRYNGPTLKVFEVV